MKRLVALLVLLVSCSISAWAAAPCCDIAGVNRASGVVTGRVRATDQLFYFKAGPAARYLKVGQPLWVNFRAKEVSLNGRSVFARISGVQEIAAPPSPAHSAAPAANNAGVEAACCVVVSLDGRGVATGRDEKSGETFQFKLRSAALFSTIRVGQPVYVNFARKQVSLDGRSVAGVVTAMGASSGANASSAAATPQPKAAASSAGQSASPSKSNASTRARPHNFDTSSGNVQVAEPGTTEGAIRGARPVGSAGTPGGTSGAGNGTQGGSGGSQEPEWSLLFTRSNCPG